MFYRYLEEEGRDYKTLRAELESRGGSLYEDPDFPANARSLYYKGTASLDIVWRRPKELVSNPVFINESATHYDVQQGELGDCWFLAGAATIAATNQRLLRRVVPFDQSFGRGYVGLFRFNFWTYDRWTEVTVDDRLPTYRGRNLIYGRNLDQPNEFWTALLEKAYAKLYGCYEAISGGRVHDAFVDMTGGISELIDMTEKDKKPNPDNLYTILSRTFNMNSLIAGAIFKTRAGPREIKLPNGLYEGHAYSITKLALIERGGVKYKLVRIRNPWGKGEWNGAWSDRSSQWRMLSTEDKRKVGLVVDNEGEFWMTVHDMVANFSEMEFTHLIPDALTAEVAVDMKKKQWETSIFKDAWVRGVSAGGCGNPPYQALYWKNPQFRLHLDPDTNGSTVVVSLLEVQKDRSKKINIGFDIYQLRPGAREEPLRENYERSALILKKSSGLYSAYREKTIRFELDPGKYVIIPSTFKPYAESEFLLRIFAEKKTDSVPLDSPTGPLESDGEDPNDVVFKLFTRYVGNKGLADPYDIRDILSEAKKKLWGQSDGFSLETCRSLLTSNDMKRKEGVVDLVTVKKIWDDLKVWKEAFRAFDRDKSGSIDTYELNEVYKLIGLSVSRRVLKSIVRRYGGRVGRMEFEDFVLSSSRLVAMYRAFKFFADSGSKATLDANEWLETTMYQ
ncbi:calpain-9-like [Liolophura sinensis]|uniref:calpain-9-like n=1 Tax=Liolophura sinensis TaxID=3198878 RepID=UPI00315861C8